MREFVWVGRTPRRRPRGSQRNWNDMMHCNRTRQKFGASLLVASLLAGILSGNSASAQVTLAEFKFDEGSGIVTASPTNTLTGTLGVPVNPDAIPVSTTDSPSGAATDRAVQLLNGAYLVVDDSVSPLLGVTTASVTLEGWVKRDSTSVAQYEGIMAYGGSYKLGLNSSEIIFTLFGVVDISSGHILPSDEWHHVAAAWEPGVGVTIYLDGNPSFVAETRAARAVLNNYLNLGAEQLGTPITGTLDRLRVHSGLLTPEQLDSVATTPKAPLANTLVAYAFNEATGPYQSGGATARPTLSGAALASQSTVPVWDINSPTGGPSDRSLNFTSGGMRVVVQDPNTAIRLDTGDFTIQAWIKFGAQPLARSVFFFNNGPGAAVSFSVSSRKLFVTTLGILDQPSNAAIPDDGGWHHVAVIHETGKEFRFYVDGILGDTIAYDRGVLIDVRTATEFFIGSEPTGGLPYVGKLDRLIVSKGIVAAENLDFRPIPGVDPSAPTLTIQTVVEVAWPSLPAGYQFQSTATPETPASWTVVTGAPTASEGVYKYYAPITAQKMFYRLVKP